MHQDYNMESPMLQLVSFNKLLEHYEEQLKSKDKYLVDRAKFVLDAQAPYPELREGFSDLSLLTKYEEVIRIILADTCSPVLGKNEIKTISSPFENFVFNSSERFKNILNRSEELNTKL